MLRKALLVLGVLVAWRALDTAGSGGHVVEIAFAWAVFAYLVYRAWPAVREDFRRLRGRYPGGRSFRVGRRGDEGASDVLGV